MKDDYIPLPAPFIDRLERLRRVNRSRALHSIARNHGDRGRYGQTFSAERQRGLLEWAATQTDEDILEWRNTGPVMLRWIRDHQPVVAETSTTLAWVMKSYGWRVELFWNSAGVWFTARLVDRDGNLMPRGDPLGVSAQSPGQALADLHDACVSLADEQIAEML
jgi:hypothetical protein